MCYNVPLGGIAKICGLNHKIAYEWRQRVFATVDGYGQASPASWQTGRF